MTDTEVTSKRPAKSILQIAFLWRMNTRRLDAESYRDSLSAVIGTD